MIKVEKDKVEIEENIKDIKTELSLANVAVMDLYKKAAEKDVTTEQIILEAHNSFLAAANYFKNKEEKESK